MSYIFDCVTEDGTRAGNRLKLPDHPKLRQSCHISALSVKKDWCGADASVYIAKADELYSSMSSIEKDFGVISKQVLEISKAIASLSNKSASYLK